MSNLLDIASSLPSVVGENSLNILLYGNKSFNLKINRNISMLSLKFVKGSKWCKNSSRKMPFLRQ